MSGELAAWLRALDVDRLAALLRRRPDAMAPPVPASPEDLAHRLSSTRSTEQALRQLSAPALSLCELLQALGSDPERTEVLQRIVMEDPAEAAAVELVLDELVSYGLAVDHDGRLHLVGALREAWQRPLGLGSSVATTLRELPASWSEQIRTTLGLNKAPSLPKAAAAIAAHLTPERIVAMLMDAPDEARELLAAVLAEGGLIAAPDGSAYGLMPSLRRGSSPWTWLVDRALLLPSEHFSLEVPREVDLALREQGWRIHLPLHPPEILTAPAAAEAVERESAAAAAEAVATATELLELMGAHPAAALKSGGLGVREVRRLAKVLRREEPVVSLACHLAGQARLCAQHGTRIVPTPAYDAWRAAEPAQRLVTLLRAWWDFPSAVSGRLDDNGRPEQPLGRVWSDPWAAALRRDLTGTLGQIAEGRGATGVSTVLGRLVWQRPMGYPPASDGTLDRLAEAAWWETERLGVGAHGRLGALGQALLSGDEAALLEHARRLLPPTVDVVMFQADLTAVVAGSPSADVAALLDEAADREARGSASTWRFTPATIRRVLDAGGDADELVGRLDAVARGDLPQPLTYLVHDVARRHGNLAVSPLACAVVSEDAALLAEVAGHRSLRALQPRLLAPTVLASAKAVAETVAMLREAGYSPVEHDTAGAVVVHRARHVRAGSARQSQGVTATTIEAELAAWMDTNEAARAIGLHQRARRPPTPAPTPEEAARTILRAPRPTDAARPKTNARDRLAAAVTTTEKVAAMAPRLAPDEVALLAYAVETGEPVTLDYVDTNGSLTRRVVSGCALDPPVMDAWCHLRQDDRVFTVSHIHGVSPV